MIYWPALGTNRLDHFGPLWTMLRGKSPNLSQKLMRWRVGLQFLAICIIVAYALLNH